MADSSFDTAFREAGGVRRKEPVPYPLTHEHIKQMCQLRERILRIQYPDDRLSDEHEAELARLSLDHPDQCFARYKLLVALSYVQQHEMHSGRGDNADTTRWQLMNREPVYVRIGNNRLVAVRSLSRAAMVRMHRHDATRHLLGEKLDLIEAAIARARSGSFGRWRTWLRVRQLRAVATRVESEIEYHFRGIIANALSETGRAMLPEEAPEWWAELGDADEAIIGNALIEAGPLRFDRGRRPAPPAKPRKGEPVTIGSLLRFWEPRLHLPPMALEDADLAQVLTALQEGAAAGAREDELTEVLQ